jgi:beta-mannosidase
MFACALYPGTDSFRKSVEEEVRQNVRRLRNHSCIALWCGNNENETAWFRKWITGGMPLGRSDSLVVRQDMKNLFHNWIPSVLSQEDPNRFYTRSSPSANDDAIAPEKQGFGDAHDWYVWFATGDYRQYANTVSRFQSEYGYQSYPAMSTIRQFSFETDWYEDSEILDVHQKHPGGTSKIRRFASGFYPKARNFNDFVYISQLQQAEAMRFAIETHRSAMPYCMGSLYWQLNDCWPAVSWSSIDYLGTWKACHYFVKKANESFRVVARVQNDTVRVSLVNERMDPMLAQSLEVKWLQFDGKVIFSSKQPLDREALIGSMKVNKVKIGLPKAASGKIDTASTVVVISVLDNNGKLLSKDFQYLTVPKYFSLAPSQLKTEFRKIPGGFRLELSSTTLVKNLMITCDDPKVQFSDNYFDILPGEQVGIDCRGLIEPALKYFSFRCLNDIIR